ncbi:MAG: sodium:calcium antiporter, partial [Victivallales bacterium]
MEFHCDNLLLNILIFVAGLWFLIKGSDIFVDSAAAIARIWKVPELVIGLTLVSIGTSLPEFASSLYAACYGETDFIIGNVVGSNVTNITLILGVGILGAGTLAFSPQLFSRDAMLMLGVFVVTDLMVFATDVQGKDGILVHGINIWSGILLLLMGIGYCVYLFRSSSENSVEDSEPDVKQPSLLKSFLWLAAGLVMIIGGSKALVDTVVWGAEQLAVDTMIISATLVAFGTSVPELAVTL